MNEQTLVPILEIKEIHKIDVLINQDDIYTIQNILCNLNTQYIYKVLILSSFMYDCDPNDVLSYSRANNKSGKKNRHISNIRKARCMWINLLNDYSGLTVCDISKLTLIPSNKLKRFLADHKKDYVFGTLMYEKYNEAKEILLNIKK